MMNSLEEKYLPRISPLFRYGRKSLGKNQVEMSELLEMSQAHLSKVEACKSMPTAVQLLEFARLTTIPLNCFSSGYLDFPKLIKLKTGLASSYLKVDKKYRTAQGLTVRFLRPLLAFFEQHSDSQLQANIFKRLKVDPDYFANWDNQLNLAFLFDLLLELKKQELINEESLSDVLHGLQDAENFGCLQKYFDQASDGLDVIHTYIINAKKFQIDFSLKIEDISADGMTFSLEPEGHIQGILRKYREDGGELFSAFFKSYFEQLANYKTLRSATLEVEECVFINSLKSVYKLVLI